MACRVVKMSTDKALRRYDYLWNKLPVVPRVELDHKSEEHLLTYHLEYLIRFHLLLRIVASIAFHKPWNEVDFYQFSSVSRDVTTNETHARERIILENRAPFGTIV